MDHYALAKIVDSRKIHASKLQSLINIHWKLQGWISVVKYIDNSFLIQFEFKEDLLYMCCHGSWVLKGYFIYLIPWNFNVPMSIGFAHTYSIWIQIHGLPLDNLNEKAAKFFGDSLGKFICYDDNSLCKGKGLRVRIQLSDKKPSFNLGSLNLFHDHIRGVHIVLEQVGRICPRCLCIGHVDRYCKASTAFQAKGMISAVGNKSVSVEYDRFSGCYWSNFKETGIKLIPIMLDRTPCKRKWENLEKENCVNKRPCLNSYQGSDQHLSSSASVLISPESSFNITIACELSVAGEPLSSKADNPKQFQNVRRKRKRFWGEIVAFPPPFKKRHEIQEINFPSKKQDCTNLKEKGVDLYFHLLSKKRAPADDDSHVQLHNLYHCSSRKRPWNDIPHVQSLGFSGVCAKKLRVSG